MSGLDVLGDVLSALRSIADAQTRMEHRMAQAIEAASQPRPEYETLVVAAKRRRRSRDTITAAVARGEIRAHRQPGQGGKLRYLLSVDDLNRLFPVIQ